MTPNWLEYDWQVRNAPAQFLVDLAYFENIPEGHETLLWLSLACPELSRAFRPAESRRGDGVFKKAQKALHGAKYVGAIFLPAQRQYYFYTRDEAQLEALEALAGKESKLLLTCGRAPEPGWQTYHKLLYPDAAKFQTVDNKKTIELLKRQGDGLTFSRRLRFYLFFPTEPSRLLFQEQARLNGFALGNPIYRPEQELSYGVVVFLVSSLDKREIDSHTTRAIREAERQGGAMFGWDCPVIPKRSPLQ